MKKLALFLFVFMMAGGACRPTYTAPDGTEMTCSYPKDGRATCVGGGRSYSCVASPGGCAIDECGVVQVQDQ